MNGPRDSVDPLQLLRTVYKGGGPAVYDANVISFRSPNVQIPDYFLCQWRDKNGYPYSLGQLWQLLFSKEFENGSADEIESFLSERRLITSFFETNTDENKRLDFSIPLATHQEMNRQSHTSDSCAPRAEISNNADEGKNRDTGNSCHSYEHLIFADVNVLDMCDFSEKSSAESSDTLMGSLESAAALRGYEVRDLPPYPESRLDSGYKEKLMKRVESELGLLTASPNDLQESELLEIPAANVASRVLPIFQKATQVAQLKQQNSNKRKSDNSQWKTTKSSPLPITIPTGIPTKNSLSNHIQSWKSRPIIILPSVSSSSHINMSNAESFFLHRNFIPPSKAITETTPLQFEWHLTSPQMPLTDSKMDVARERPSIPSEGLNIRVMDNRSIHKFSKTHWYSTIAVIVHGAEWQFQNWPFKNLIDVFSTIHGFYIAYEDEVIPAFVRKWRIDVLYLNRSLRHTDAAVWVQLIEGLRTKLNGARDFRKFDRYKLSQL